MYTLRNRIQLIGHLGQAPEVKTFDSGKKKAYFSLATNETYKNEGTYIPNAGTANLSELGLNLIILILTNPLE